jgi:LuxR family transcriptional regulator, quorum-sensing system regulator SolR
MREPHGKLINAVRIWRDDRLDGLSSASDEKTLFDRLVHVVGELGFDQCSYGFRSPLPISDPKIMLFDNYTDYWRQRYGRMNYFAVDPTMKHGMSSLLPLEWSEGIFAQPRDFWEEARGQGLCHGWAQPCRGPAGTTGMLTVARSHQPLTERELQDYVPRLVWITQVLHVKMTELVIGKLVPDHEVQLSKREVEITRWTAEGKSAAEIAAILYLSESTVNFHIANVVRKLNAANKTAAAVRASMLGLLDGQARSR